MAQAATEGRYVVLEIDRFDQVTLAGARPMPLTGAESNRYAGKAIEPSRGDALEMRLLGANGDVLWTRVITVDRHVRTTEILPDGSILCRSIERERTPFAVRIPRTGDALEVIVTASRRVARFALDEIELAVDQEVPDAVVRESAAPPANRFDLLILGDGYTAAEQEDFEADVEQVTEQFFSAAPYDAYRSFAGISSLFVASAQSGADHPVCADGAGDPKAGTFVETAFDATFCTSGLHRLLTVNLGKVLLAAAAVPDWDQILVLVNDTAYGGAGGSVMVASMNPAAVPVAQHEFGHTFTRLADEYSSPYPGYPICSDVIGPVCEANVTDQMVRSAIKWSPWIDAATPIPTPPGTAGVGLFQGARYLATGMFRPASDCAMRTLGAAFCPICSESFVLALYSGGWGTPAGGIDLIDAVDPPSGAVIAPRSVPLTFSAELLRPGAAMPVVQWLVDGAVIAGESGSSFTFVPTASHTVELRVSDPTPLVHPGNARADALESSRTWSITTAVHRKRRAVR